MKSAELDTVTHTRPVRTLGISNERASTCGRCAMTRVTGGMERAKPLKEEPAACARHAAKSTVAFEGLGIGI